MAEPRSIVEILDIVYNFITTTPEYDHGLCWNATELFNNDALTRKESKKFRDYIEEKYDGPRCEWNTRFYFEPGERQPRIEFIKQLISQL